MAVTKIMLKREEIHPLQAFSLVFNDKRHSEYQPVNMIDGTWRATLPELGFDFDPQNWRPSDLELTDVDLAFEKVRNGKLAIREPIHMEITPGK